MAPGLYSAESAVDMPYPGDDPLPEGACAAGAHGPMRAARAWAPALAPAPVSPSVATSTAATSLHFSSHRSRVAASTRPITLSVTTPERAAPDATATAAVVVVAARAAGTAAAACGRIASAARPAAAAISPRRTSR